jgi:uncharacterized protein (DUF58 family)
MSLLTPDFVRELEILHRRLEIGARSGAFGAETARRLGSSAEFEEHRPYAPGVDPRHIDWLAFARTGTPVLKAFRAEEDAIVRLLLDASASLGFGSPPKLASAKRFAAAVGYLALRGSRRAQVVVAQQRGDAPRPLASVGTPRRGRAGLHGLLNELDAPSAEGRADLGRAVEQTVVLAKKPGLLVVLSDFLDAGPVTSALDRARAAGHEVALVQVLASEELEPTLEGDLALVDSETGQSVEVTADAAALEAYALRLSALIEQLRVWCRRQGAPYTRVTSGEALDPPLRRFVARDVD